MGLLTEGRPGDVITIGESTVRITEGYCRLDIIADKTVPIQISRAAKIEPGQKMSPEKQQEIALKELRIRK